MEVEHCCRPIRDCRYCRIAILGLKSEATRRCRIRGKNPLLHRGSVAAAFAAKLQLANSEVAAL